ncbi:hypothetical protein SDRG_12261 [Saprolegnia diclina VS20]|uniref:USP domain-containing protein n=1 Tax=Saprolegnia diclina (strain VS20) TaxID=1156394 RepID=T0RJG9_SAPDV|nr:hypothetical protein SDRG_12261 [Saprolegnia diclina VS20]EQC29982.1 hypothetical protein SDRG_12261 [Saprolegnia diclina VS20]|eukprot:XP_008616549.1 hypothetical protein SDRG_12261 [Saprolegnia diclina VS20]
MWVGAVDITYGQALGPPGYHRATSPLGVAAEVAPQTYLWYKTLATATPLRDLRVGRRDATLPDGFTRLPKAVLRTESDADMLFLWTSTRETTPETTYDYDNRPLDPLRPIKELKIVRSMDDVPPSFECAAGATHIDLGIICFRRATSDEIERVEEEAREPTAAVVRKTQLGTGLWVDVLDPVTTKWYIGQVRGNTNTTLPSAASAQVVPQDAWLVHLPGYKTPFKELLVPSAHVRTRTAPIGTHTDLHASPSYPLLRVLPRRHVGRSDIATMQTALDACFFDMTRSFFADALLPFLEAVLAAPCRELDVANGLQSFFQHTLKYWASFVLSAETLPLSEDRVSSSHFMAVAKLLLNGFDGCNGYYLPDTHAVGWEAASDLEHVTYLDHVASGAYRSAPCRSMYFVETVEYFFQVGGYRAIVQRVKDASIPLSEVDMYLSFFLHAKPILTPTTADEEQLVTLLHAVLGRLATVDMELIKDDSGLLDALLEKVETLFGVLHTVDVLEHLELAHLGLAKAYLCCPYLGQQLAGLTRLLHWMEKAQRHDAFLAQHTSRTSTPIPKKRIGSFGSIGAMLRTSSTSITSSMTITSSTMPPPSVCARWLRAETFVQWVLDANVLDLVLGDAPTLAAVGLRDAHIEVWKRTGPLLLLVAQQEKLTRHHLHLLWAHAIKPQQSYRRKTVFEMLLHLASSMVVSLIGAVAELWTDVATYDALTVHFLTRITRLANGKAHQAQIGDDDRALLDGIAAKGVDLLWHAMLANPGEVLAPLTTLLHDMDAIESTTRRRDTLGEYVARSIDSLRRGCDVSTHLTLLETIVRGAAPDESALQNVTSAVILSSLKNAMKIHPFDSVLQRFETSFQLVSLVLDLVASHPTESLVFLAFVLTNSGLGLTFDHLAHIQAAVDRTAFYGWLQLVLPECLDAMTMKGRAVLPMGFLSNGAFTVDVLERIFDDTVCVDAAMTSSVEFECFERLFRYLNHHAQRLTDAHLPRDFVVDAPMDRLKGFGRLYMLALRSGNDDVSEAARDYIVYLLQHLSVKRLVRLDVWLFFAKHAASALDVGTSMETSRALNLLSTFLHHARPLQAAAARVPSLEPLVVYIKSQDGRTSPPLHYNVPKSCLVGELRDRIAADVGHFAEGIRLLTDTKTRLSVRNHNHMTLAAANVFNSMTQRSYVEVILLKKPETDTIGHIKSNPLQWTTQDAASDWATVQTWLGANVRSTLLTFVSHPRLAEAAWRLLSLLLVQTALLEQVHLLHVDDWSDVLSGQSALLLYHLQVLQPYQSQLEWMRRFVGLRGPEHVCELILAGDAAAVTRTLDAQCWRSLFKWLSVSLHEKLEWTPTGEDKVWHALVHKIVLVTQHVLTRRASTVATKATTTVQYPVPPLVDDESDVSDRLLANAVALLQRLLAAHKSAAPAFVSHPNAPDVVLGALEHPSASVRSDAATCVRGLCDVDASLLSFAINLFAGYDAPTIVHMDLLYVYGDLVQKGVPDGFDTASAALRLARRLESLAPGAAAQPIFEGLLHTLLCLLKPNKDAQDAVLAQLDLIHELYLHCLFPEAPLRPSTTDLIQPKCTAAGARALAFQLLSVLCDAGSAGLAGLLAKMRPQHSFERNPAKPVKAKKGNKKKIAQAKPTVRGPFVGLKNLGCTCYLNSVVQACFFIPAFRALVFSTPASRPHSLLFQIQSLFAHLSASSRPYVSPAPLLSVLHTSDGSPINVKLQQDASEFLTSFLQQLESEINGNHTAETQLHASLGGLFSNELVADGDKYSERLEPFHFVSVQVRDRPHLEASLDSWVDGDMVSYTWDTPNDGKQTLETHKRISIHTLPNVLVFHLKRFEFDFETMQQIKLHDAFEFPMELDMRRYTKEGQARRRNEEDMAWRAPEYYLYECSGAIVHVGTAQSGHYYCYLRDPKATASWVECNDTLVTPFDATQLPHECFGGLRAHDDGRRSPSAFMLLYTRKATSIPVAMPAPVRRFASIVRAVVFLKRLLKRRALVPSPAPLPSAIYASIEAENRSFWRKQYLADVACKSFTHDLVANCFDANMVFAPASLRLEALQFATAFVFGTLWQCREVDRIGVWTPMLTALYDQEPLGADWFLQSSVDHPTLLADVIVDEDDVVMAPFRHVARVSLQHASTPALASAFVAKCVGTQLSTLRPVVLDLLHAYAAQSSAACHELVKDHHLLTVLPQALLDADEGGNERHESRLLTLIAMLLDAYGQDDLYAVLPAEAIELLTSSAWMHHLLERRGATFSFNDETLAWRRIVWRLCTGAAATSSAWLSVLLAAIESNDHHELKPYFRALMVLLSLDDDLAMDRLDDAMTQFIALLASQQRYFKATETSIDMMCRIAKRIPTVRTWLYENQRSWAWTEKWLEAHAGPQGWLQQGKTVLVKPHSTSTWKDVPLSHPALAKTIDRSVAKFVPRVRALLAGQAPSDVQYDSDDDPIALVGARIKVKWAREKWYAGRVERYDPAKLEHSVVYDDGEKKSYKMTDKVFLRLDVPAIEGP